MAESWHSAHEVEDSTICIVAHINVGVYFSISYKVVLSLADPVLDVSESTISNGIRVVECILECVVSCRGT